MIERIFNNSILAEEESKILIQFYTVVPRRNYRGLNPVYHRQIQLKEDDNELKKRVTSRMLTSKFDERDRI